MILVSSANFWFRQRKRLGKDVSADMGKGLDPIYSDKHQLECTSAAEVESTDWDVLPTSNSVPALLESDSLIANWDGSGPSGDIGGNYDNNSMEELDSLHGSLRKKGYLRPKYFPGHFVKPLNSIESCLMAQLPVEHADMEEYVLSAPPSPCRPTMRPLLVTNGSKIIGRARGDFSSAQIRIDDDRQSKEGIVSGVPQLPSVGYSGHPRKLKLKRRQGHNGKLSSSSKLHSRKHFQPQHGPHNGAFLFYLGVSIGVIYSFMTNTREVNKLKELLKQTESLVQDLQEELDMKESLTVKELADETSQSQDGCDHASHDIAQPFFSEHYKNNSTGNDSKECNNEKAVESSESMSKIEAELEAELERLDLNINTSIYQRRLPNLDVLDTDFAADFAEGELKVDMVDGQTVSHLKSNQDKSGTSTDHFQNYVVSPRELSLRLHEVIQSRLEERVNELETALQSIQRKMQLGESEYDNSWRKLAYHELIYSFMPESPIAKEESNSIPQSLVMNLSEAALDAYNESYEELMKTNESEEEDSLSGVHRNIQQMDLQSISWGKNGELNGLHHTPSKEEASKEFCSSQVKSSPKQCSRVQELLDVGTSADENTDSDDEMDQQLIKQIVEKTKKGSPVVLNAHKALFLMNEIEH
ncbi:uncharacterized protein LOC119979958 isoform X2 [Tripterygium wilfordii]|uniref:uncharacterized protein LOC119979958 isoform X2 n=1 Tax=Tripterygium wilfordii TaxID=458696 RepID=UPI0018F843A3|nr:uncharacterized protein LOC119979958 isoform X2 [Tripterygium wilfordii]XP_038678512.1 uncharacterized protein LOC119979958 isoform X2 [Tripterygium wilfordii]XP_038678513.1 uncharacterized protein LOC119979958 isoform X2 [Tripterygium wilfordii]XP_038678514.1 uncharacterized protein LOC119979958 isoform X2 [Tripterygium wilfordii]